MTSVKRSRNKNTVPVLQPPKRICSFLIVDAEPEAKDVVFASAKFFLYHHNAYEHIDAIISDLVKLEYGDDVLCILRFVQWLNEVD
jgi:hypothetical protein